MTSIGLQITSSKDKSVHAVLDRHVHMDIMLLGFHVLINVIRHTPGARTLTRLLPVQLQNGRPCVGSARIDDEETPWIDFDTMPDVDLGRYDMAFTQAYRQFLEINQAHLLYLADLRGGDAFPPGLPRANRAHRLAG
jgi:hypothetical protein